MSNSKEYRYVYGVAYPHLVDGRRTGKLLLSNEANQVFEQKERGELNQKGRPFKKTFFDDPATRLHRGHTNETRFFGKPMFVNHRRQKQVGILINGWNDPDKHGSNLIILGKIVDPQTIKDYDNGLLAEFSVGCYLGMERQDPNDDSSAWCVTDEAIEEVSLCSKGFFPGTVIRAGFADGTYVEMDDEELKTFKTKRKRHLYNAWYRMIIS